MKLQKVLFLLLGLAFLVSLGSLISGGASQKAQVVSSSQLAITPANQTSVAAGSTINASCSYSPAPSKFVLVGAVINPYSATVINETSWGNTQTSVSGSVTVPVGATGEYHIQCVAYLPSGETLNQSNVLNISSSANPPSGGTATGPDTQNPTRPTNISNINRTSSSISISWSPSTDNVAVAKYNIYRNYNNTTTGVNNTTPYAEVSHPITTFTDNGLVAGRTYRYRVRAVDTSGRISDWGTIPSSTTTTLSSATLAVTAPTGVNISESTTNSLKINWTASTAPNVFDYVIYANNGGSTSINTTTPVGVVLAGQSTSFVHQGLNPNVQYSYRVAARDDAGNRSALTTTVRGRTLTATVPPPETPTIDSVLPGSTPHSILNVTWTPVSNVGYKVFRSTGSSSPVQVSPTSLITTGSFTNTGLLANTTYNYTIQACHISTPTNCSVQSAVKSGTTAPAPDTTPPTVPSGLSVTSATSDSISISWSPSTDTGGSVAGYNVFRSDTPTGTFTQIGGNINGTSYTDTGLTSGVSRSYRVRAFDNAPTPNYSAQSSTVTGTTLSLPQVPSGVSVGSPTTTSLTVSWNAVAGVSSYRVYRMTSATGVIDATVPFITVNSPNLNTVISGLSPGTAYFFAVSSVNAVGESARSSTVSGTTSSPQITLSSVEITRPDGSPLQTLSNSAVNTINIGSQGSGLGVNISIRARTNSSDSDTGSVLFNLNGTNISPIENAPPYLMFGDNNAWPNLTSGPQTVIVTPYASDNAGGQVGVPQTFTLNFVNNDDTTPPNNPTNVTITYRSPSQIRVGWTNSTSSDVAAYRVFRNDISVGVVNHPQNSFIDTEVNATSAYSYRVVAIDVAGNEQSQPSTGTSNISLSTVFAINNQVITNASTQIRSTPESSTSSGAQPSQTIGSITNGPVWVLSGSQGINYWYVDFSSGADGWVNQSNIDSYIAPTEVLTVLPATGGTVAAGSTINISCVYNPTGNAPTQMNMWGATITPYAEFPIAAVNNTKNISGQVTVPAGSTGEFHVRCVTYGPDNGLSNVLNITSGPAAPDTTPPTITNFSPTANTVLPFGTTSANISVSTNENATCRWSTTNVSYGSMTNTMSGSGGTNHSALISGITNGQSYNRFVRCQDTAGNAMSTSQSITFSVDATAPVAPPPGGTQSMQVSTTCPTSPTSQANLQSNHRAISLCASVQNTTNPPTITLRWTPVTGRTISSITISRRAGNATSWTQVAQPASSSLTWTDTNVTEGVYYEYRVVMSTSGTSPQSSAGTAYGYISSGINVPSEVSRGRIILVIDNTFQTSLATQIQNLIDELNSDRWIVSTLYVSRTATPSSVRDSIKNIYDNDTVNTKAVYLLGHVPVAMLGNLNPDGHTSRGMSSDSFYGEMNSTWTAGCSSLIMPTGLDTGVTNLETIPTTSRFCVSNQNLPSSVELEVGRVDMHRMTAFPGTEAALITNYLNKVSNYKRKDFVPQNRALIKTTWDAENNPGWGQARSVVGSFSSLFNSNNVLINADWNRLSNVIGGQSYTWVSASYNGANTSEGTNGVSGSTQDMASSPHRGVFNVLLASYFGEWNDQNSILRSVLASGDGMSSMYGGPRYIYTHRMGMGRTIGDSFRLSVNNTTSLYEPLGGIWNSTAGGNAHMTLLGDPTLRMNYVKPPTNLNLTNSGGRVSMSWVASSDEGIGYNIYEITPNEIRRLNTSVVAGTSFNSNETFIAGKKYMVTRVKIEITNSGTYINESLGVIATTGTVSSDTTAPSVPSSITIASANSSSISFTWTASTDNVGVTGYKIFRSSTSGGTFNEIGTSNTNSYTDSVLSPSTTYWYRISAYDAAGNNSAQSSAQSFSTISGQQVANALMGLNGAVGPNNTVNATPGPNPFGRTDYFISCDGNDSNNGTSISTPWRSLSKLDGVKFNLQPGTRIMLKRGCEYQGYFHVVSSGTTSQPIEYTAYGTGSAPIVSGTTMVTNWTLDSGNIYRANVGTGLNPKYLLVGSEVQPMAQTPNPGNWYFTDSRTTTSITDSSLSSFSSGSLVGAEMVLRSEPWAWTSRNINGHNGSTISFDYAHILTGWEDTGWAFALKNKRSFIDSPGEWFYDRVAGILYFQAPGNVNPNTLQVKISNRDFGFDFGTNQSYININNIILEGFQQRGIRLENNKGVKIENVEIRKSSRGVMGGTGFNNPVSDGLVIRNSHIHNIFGPDGIWLLGSNGNLIENNIVEKVFLNPMIDMGPAWEWANGFGIRVVDINSNFIIRNNIVRETGYIGIVVSGKAFNGNNSLVEKNLVSKVDMMANDGGGISFDYVDGLTVQDNIVKETSFETNLMPVLYPGYRPIAFDYYYGNMSIKNLILRRNVSINSPSTGIWRDSDLHNTGLQFLDNVIYGAGDYGIGIALTSVEQDYGLDCSPSGNSRCYVSSFNDIWNGNRVYQNQASQPAVFQLQTWSNGNNTPTRYGSWSNNYFFNPFRADGRIMQEYRHYNSAALVVGDPIEITASGGLNVRSTNSCMSSAVLGTQPAGAVGIIQEVFGDNCIRVTFSSGASGWIYRWGGLKYANRNIAEWQTRFTTGGTGNTRQVYTLTSLSQMPPLYVNETNSPKTVNIGTGKCDHAGQPLPSSYTLPGFASVIIPENCSLQ